MIYFTWQKLAKEKRRHKVPQILCGFVFILFQNLVFVYKVNHPRIYADLLRFESRVKVHTYIHIVIVMKSIIHS